MLTARRLYLYGVSAAGLGLLVAGLVMLVRLLFDQVGFGAPAAEVFTPALDRTREDLSLAVALTLVGLPLWLGHTWYTERLVQGTSAAAEAERQSVVRAVYFTLALAATLWAGAISTIDVLREGMYRLQGIVPGYDADVPASLATAIVALLAWGYLAWTRARDVRAGPMRGAAAWVSRLGLYGAVAAGGLCALFAVSDIIATLLSAVVGRAPLEGGTDWWTRPIIASIALVVVGTLLWLGHWGYAERLTDAAHAWAPDERVSRMRAAAMLLVIAVCVAAIIGAVASAIGAAFEWMLGVAVSDDIARLVQDVVGPPIAAVPFMVAWWWHHGRAVSEARLFGGEARRASIERLSALVVSVVALVATGVAAAWTLGLLLDVAVGGSRTVASFDREWRTQLAQFAGYLLAAAPIWLIAWTSVQEGRRVAPDLEAASSARRGYLFLVGGVTLVAAAGSLAVILYDTIRVVVGLQSTSLASDLSAPAGVLLVATGLLAYHATVFRGDALARAGALAGAALEATEELEIVGPAGADFEPLNAAFRSRLPPGFSLRVTGHHGASGAG